MNLSTQIAKHFRAIHFGGNWTTSNLKDNLADVTWQQATTKVHNLNTIAMLTFHINYYISGVLKVLQGGALETRDKYSYDCPPIECQEDWEKMKAKVWKDAEDFANLLEQLPENAFNEDFIDPKYGNYYRNIHGIIEHSHYHLGQIAIIKKILN